MKVGYITSDDSISWRFKKQHLLLSLKYAMGCWGILLWSFFPSISLYCFSDFSQTFYVLYIIS